MPIGRDQPPGRSKQLPRGRHGLPRSVVVENQRGRIFEALAAVCAAKGYAEVTVRDITEHAGVSRHTFYELFSDKEQCFLATYDGVVHRLLDRVSAAYYSGDRSWPERISAAVRALVQSCADDPNLARLTMVEVLSAGPQALACRDAALRRFAVFFEPGRVALPADMESQQLLAQGVIGGLYEALYAQILDGQTERLPELLPDLVYCVLVPYLGHAPALAASEAERLRAEA
jgi:AcrR family transcriptional regulator